MREKEFREYCRGRGLGEDDAESAVAAVREFEGHLGARGASLESMDVDDVKEYVSLLISEGRNSMDRLLAIARYCYIAKKDDAYIYFTQIIGGRTVLPSISERLAQIAGEEKRDVVFEGVEAPPLGAPPEQFPRVTGLLMERLESELDQETRRKVLAGNHHRVPVESFAKHKEWYRTEGMHFSNHLCNLRLGILRHTTLHHLQTSILKPLVYPMMIHLLPELNLS